MSEKVPARPPQVTMAGWVSIVGSTFVVLSAFDFMANLRSIETREQVRRSLENPPLEGTGLGLQQMLDVLHGMALIAAACASATAILGWYVMRRHAQARLVLTVLALPLFLAGTYVSGLLAAMVAAAAFLLWTRPARDWFAGRPWQTASPGLPGRRETPASRVGGEHPPPAYPPQAPDRPDQPGPTDRSGEAPPPYAGYGASSSPAGPTSYADRERPGELLQACILTWVFAGTTLVVCGLMVLLVAVDPGIVGDLMEADDRYEEMGLDRGSVRTGAIVVGTLFAVWSAGAILLAVLAFAGRPWARVGLLVSAILAGGVSVASAISSPVALVVTLACGFAALQLNRPAVRRWTRRR